MRPDERAALHDLLVRGADGDRAALEAAFARARPLVLDLCRRVLGDLNAEDAAQDALIKLFHHMHAYDRTRDPVPWVLAFATNACRTQRRQRDRRREQPDPPEQRSSEDAEGALLEAELRAAVQATMGALSPLDAETLALAMGERPRDATYRKRLERAMTRFRAIWSPE